MMTRFALLVLTCPLFGACGGDDDEPECVPGDASRADLICSPDGRWVSRSGPAPGCELPQGNYAIEYTAVSDTCEIGNLPTELFTILADGTGAGAAASTEPPDGCEDTAQRRSGCTVAWERACRFVTESGIIDAQYAFVLNTQTRSGSVSIDAQVDDAAGSTLICASDQLAEILPL